MGAHRILTWRDGDPDPATQATPHQRAVILGLKGRGQTIPQIAHALHLSPQAIRNVIRGRDPESQRLAAEHAERSREVKNIFADISRMRRGGK